MKIIENRLFFSCPRYINVSSVFSTFFFTLNAAVFRLLKINASSKKHGWIINDTMMNHLWRRSFVNVFCDWYQSNENEKFQFSSLPIVDQKWLSLRNNWKEEEQYFRLSEGKLFRVHKLDIYAYRKPFCAKDFFPVFLAWNLQMFSDVTSCHNRIRGIFKNIYISLKLRLCANCMKPTRAIGIILQFL